MGDLGGGGQVLVFMPLWGDWRGEVAGSVSSLNKLFEESDLEVVREEAGRTEAQCSCWGRRKRWPWRWGRGQMDSRATQGSSL